MTSFTKQVLSFEDAKQLDKFAQDFTKVSGIQWMGWAALSIFHSCRELFLTHKEIIILCGSGNNGGDGYALAYFLQSEGHSVRIFCDEPPRSEQSLYYKDLLSLTKVPILNMNEIEEILQKSSHSLLIVDCLFGIGGRLPMADHTIEFMKKLHHWKDSQATEFHHFLSIDAISGRNPWEEWNSELENEISNFPADTLAEIGSTKWENFGFPYENKIYVPIGFPSTEFSEQNASSLRIIHLESIPKELILKSLRKSKQSHKYKAGSCLFYGAEEGMEGAILLSLSAFLGLGGGISKVNSISKKIWNHKESLNPSYMINTERIHYWEDPFFQKVNGLVWGPGTSIPLVADESVLEEWKQVRNFPEKYFIIDAGRIPSLSIFQKYPELKFHPRCILTAHFGEFNRLTECGSKVWKDRIDSGIELSKKIDAYILLKESYSLLFSPNGEFYIWDKPNSKLATMGTGDLLTGILALYLSRSYTMVDSVHFALNTMNLSKQISYHSPTSWEILEYLKKV